MLDLSPVKLLLVFIVAMILVGPDKLPQVARQLGAGWRKVRQFHEQVDREVRENIPDLPSTSEIARLARSPVALLNQLARSSTDDLVEDPAATNGTAGHQEEKAQWPEDPSAVGAPSSGSVEPPPLVAGGLPEVPDDPNLN
ncbi:MAG: twin-arginine translocase TatA/TatE family subunit [Acidimicrobiales bacterium]